MIDVTSFKVLQNLNSSTGARKCGILGGVGCIAANLFQNSLSSRGIEPVTPCPSSQDLLQSIIYRIKAGDKGPQVVSDFTGLLRELREERECSQIILGCTELPLIIEDCMKLDSDLKAEHLVDSTEIMVETCVKIAKRDLDISELLEQLEGSSTQTEVHASIESDMMSNES